MSIEESALHRPGDCHRRPRWPRRFVRQRARCAADPAARAGGNGAAGTNPEQLFAAGYSACFLSALQFVAGKEDRAAGGFEDHRARRHRADPDGLRDRAKRISVPGLARDKVQALVEKAHIVCPYSNATRGNIDVKLIVE